MPWHGHAIVTEGKWRGGTGADGCGEVRGRCQGAERVRLDQVHLKFFSMGSMVDPACKLFDQMPERNLFSKFGNSFGGLHSYNI
jgi:hypothetical protein